MLVVAVEELMKALDQAVGPVAVVMADQLRKVVVLQELILLVVEEEDVPVDPDLMVLMVVPES
tara:strand:+ start:530 stop:718 length:189 start_codon:yes stop_codon:yes gene_type:complete